MKKSNMLVRQLLVALILAMGAGTAGIAVAKLPVPAETPESKAKAEEAKAKAAEASKKAAADLALSQDKAVANYKARQPK